MTSSPQSKKRKLATINSTSATPKRARKSLHEKNNAATTIVERPSSAATDQTFLTARSSSDVEDKSFATPSSGRELQNQEPSSSLVPNGSSLPTANARVDPAIKLAPGILQNKLEIEQGKNGDVKKVKKVKKNKRKKNAHGAGNDLKGRSGNAVHNSVRTASRHIKRREYSAESDISAELSLQRVASHEAWALSPLYGGCFLEQDPIFVQDGSGEHYVAIATSRAVHLLSLNSSLIERSSSAPKDLYVQAITPTILSGTILILYSNGTINEWDLHGEQKLRQSPDPKLIIDTFGSGVFPGSKAERIITIATGSIQSKIYFDKVCIHSTHHPISSIKVLGETGYIIAVGPSVVILGRKKHDQSERNSAEQFIWIELPIATKVTCFDASYSNSPDQGGQGLLSVVIGTAQGQLQLYDDLSHLFSKKLKHNLPPPRILHWHREPVLTVKFSQDRNYLISGGSETVLVLWQLATGRKQFLPHLTSTIERLVVSPAGDRYAISLGDNSIMVLSTSELKPVANLAGLQSAASAVVNTPIPAVLHPHDPSRLLLVVPSTRPSNHTTDANSRPFLQTFDIRHARHITRQALTRNNTTDFNLGPEGTPIIPPDVSSLQISTDGQWLATVDDWRPPISDIQALVPQGGPLLAYEHSKRHETHIKIWKWNQHNSLWTLTSRIDGPHTKDPELQPSHAQIRLIADPAGVGFASLGQDDCVRIWRPKKRLRNGVAMKLGDGTEMMEWICKQTIELPLAPKRADSPFDSVKEGGIANESCLAWSEDGSILVAAQASEDVNDAPVLHFVDVTNGAVTTQASAVTGLVSMAFLDRYFITVGGSGEIVVWDVVLGELRHSHQVPTSQEVLPTLAVNHTNGTYIVCCGTRAHIFRISQAEEVCQIELETIAAALLAHERGYLVLYTDGSLQYLVPSVVSASEKSLIRREEDQAIADVDDVDVAVDTPLTLHSQGVPLTSRKQIGLANYDDRPVVRPEQLADMFETSQSFAMLSVRDMLHAVVDLYGRKASTITKSTGL